MWTAATCPADTRAMFIAHLAYWLNETVTDRPFSDLYDTITGDYVDTIGGPVRFHARPVVGGHFSLLALEKSKHLPQPQRKGQRRDSGLQDLESKETGIFGEGNREDREKYGVDDWLPNARDGVVKKETLNCDNTDEKSADYSTVLVGCGRESDTKLESRQNITFSAHDGAYPSCGPEKNTDESSQAKRENEESDRNGHCDSDGSPHHPEKKREVETSGQTFMYEDRPWPKGKPWGRSSKDNGGKGSRAKREIDEAIETLSEARCGSSESPCGVEEKREIDEMSKL